MTKRLCGLLSIWSLLLLLASCSSVSTNDVTITSSEVHHQIQLPSPCIMQGNEKPLLQETVGSTEIPKESNSEKSEDDFTAESFELPEEYVMEDFPIIYQMPELPTGCEITALTMALHYYGYDVDKSTMAAEYLPTVPANQYYGEDGRLYGSDL